MRLECVEKDPIRHGWCDFCDDMTEYLISGGVSNVSARLCRRHLAILVKAGVDRLTEDARKDSGSEESSVECLSESEGGAE